MRSGTAARAGTCTVKEKQLPEAYVCLRQALSMGALKRRKGRWKSVLEKFGLAGEDFVLRIRLKNRNKRMGGQYETRETVLVVFCRGCRRFAVCRTDCAGLRISVIFSVAGAMLFSSFLERPSADGLFILRKSRAHIKKWAFWGSYARASFVPQARAFWESNNYIYYTRSL